MNKFYDSKTGNYIQWVYKLINFNWAAMKKNAYAIIVKQYF